LCLYELADLFLLRAQHLCQLGDCGYEAGLSLILGGVGLFSCAVSSSTFSLSAFSSCSKPVVLVVRSSLDRL
jgi:hypothetical protein